MSFDCYVRMPAEWLTEVRWLHLQSGVDVDDAEVGASRACEAACGLTSIGGYTEWVSDSAPTLSVGWDWNVTEHGLQLDHCSVRTNLMLVDRHGRDQGPSATARTLVGVVEALSWRSMVLEAVQDPCPAGR